MELADYSECNVMVLMMENNVILFSGGMNGDGCRAQLYHCLLIFKTSFTNITRQIIWMLFVIPYTYTQNLPQDTDHNC